MKKQLLMVLLLAFTAVSTMAQNVGDAIYIYRNDGFINGFVRDDIDSIAYSYLDVDSVLYDEIVTQEVYTIDSIYRIPLAVIDSVSFVTPKTVYQPGVINIVDELMPYAISCDSLTIIFSLETPQSILPQIGSKLVSVVMNDIFPAGFIGKVKTVSLGEDGYVVSCSAVKLEDIFETYYSVTSTYGYKNVTDSNNKDEIIKKSPQKVDLDLGTFSWSKTDELGLKLMDNPIGGELALKGGRELSVNITPLFHILNTFIISKEHGTYYSSCITGEVNIQEGIGLYGGLEWSKDFLDVTWIKSAVAPFVFFYLKPGLFIRAGVTASFTMIFSQQFKTIAAYDYSSKGQNMLKPTCNVRPLSHSVDVEGCLDGNVAGGAFLEFGLTFLNDNIDKLCFRGELGMELVGQAVLYNSEIANAKKEVKTYEKFKNSSVKENVFVSTAVQAEFDRLNISSSLPINLKYNLKKWDVVPSFSGVKLEKESNDYTKLKASAIVQGNCFSPIDFGFVLRDSKNNDAGQYYNFDPYKNKQLLFEHQFDNLNENKKYKLNPVVALFGYEFIAYPEAEAGYDISISTNEVDDIKTDFAVASGTISGDDYNNQVYGICYGKITQDKWNFKRSYNRNENGIFSVNLIDLEPDTEYGYCAYVKLESETIFGETKSFQTEKELAVTTLAASNVTNKTAVMSGRLENYKADKLAGYGIAYGSSAGSLKKVPASDLSADGTFSLAIKGLEAETTYYFQAYGMQDGKEYTGQTLSFKTEKKDPDDPDNPDNPDDPDNPDAPDNPDDPDDFDELLTHLCPDDNHPHMIDLGLPSGTKWACCNVGANKPEDSGGYYYWGETEERDVYFCYYYKYWTVEFDENGAPNFTPIPIGDDIAGTSYDVARAIWGGGWQMPTRNQAEELFRMVDSMEKEGEIVMKETSYHGMKGVVIKGTNGNGVFFPYAGGYPAENVDGFPLQAYGEEGDYWISERYLGEGDGDERVNELMAYLLGFKSKGNQHGIGLDLKATGLPVRPVCK